MNAYEGFLAFDKAYFNYGDEVMAAADISQQLLNDFYERITDVHSGIAAYHVLLKENELFNAIMKRVYKKYPRFSGGSLGITFKKYVQTHCPMSVLTDAYYE